MMTLKAEQMQDPTLADGNHVGGGDLSTSSSYSSYRSVMTTLSSSSSAVDHPLFAPPSVATVPQDADPPLSPPQIPSIEVPSYADVIFTPFPDGSPDFNGSGGRPGALTISPRSQSSSSEHLKISVSNPQKEVDSSNAIVPGGNTYVTYLITTCTDIAGYGGSDFSVRRRFKDVVTLSDRLAGSYRGIFIPPRPDKSVVESQVMQKQEFVEKRRVELEMYLKRLAKHPVIKKSDELRVFLTVQGRMSLPATIDVASRFLDGAVKLPKQLLGESRSVVEPQEVVQPAKRGNNLLRFFRELKQSVVNDWGNSRPPLEEEDKEFLEKKEKLQELGQQLSNASKQAESFVKAQQEIGNTMGELGLTLIKVAKFENEQTVVNSQRTRVADMKTFATSAVKVSRLYRELNAQTVKHLDTLQEHMGSMLAMHNAFSDRDSALLTVQTLVAELDSLRSRAENFETSSSKRFGSDKSMTQKSEELNDAIKATNDAKSCAVREYERIKENNRSEIQRLDGERQADFVNMVKGFITNQVAYSEKIRSEWAEVAEKTSKYARDYT